MTVKIKKSGHYLSKINGQPIINNQYALDIDSDRKKNEQVLGMFKNNGIVSTMHDSFQNYMNKMSSKNQSIFDLLKSERNEISKMPNSVMKVVDSSSKPIMSNVIPMSKKMIINQKTKKKVNSHNVNGISSKLFDFTNIANIAPNPIAPNPVARNPNNHSRKKRRKRYSRRNRKNKKSYK
jgi:membrane-associated HD superfamily phosphohydrolase